MLTDSTRDDNILMFVRFVSCVMIRDHKDNTDSVLCEGRQFVGEFSDALEVETIVSEVDERGIKY